MAEKRCVAIVVANGYHEPSEVLLFRLPQSVIGDCRVSPWQVLVAELPDGIAAPDHVSEIVRTVLGQCYGKHCFVSLGTRIAAPDAEMYPYLFALPKNRFDQYRQLSRFPVERLSLETAVERCSRIDAPWQQEIFARVRALTRKRGAYHVAAH